MEKPTNTKLPFFAYGVFKPGELAFLQLKDLVESCRDCSVPGNLLIRDGLPIADPRGRGAIQGVLLTFRAGSESTAYERIAQLEPEHQYRWEVAPAPSGSANYLVGRSPNKGSEHLDEDWSGRRDPLFTSALEVVAETLEQNRNFEWDLKPLFRLEMAYLLLWSSIERYSALRYHLSKKVHAKIEFIAAEPAFQEALKEFAPELREVYRADEPETSYELDPGDPGESLDYYYQVRCNLVHRGKGVVNDHKRLLKSLQELLPIFRAVLQAAFEESKWTPAVE